VSQQHSKENTKKTLNLGARLTGRPQIKKAFNIKIWEEVPKKIKGLKIGQFDRTTDP